MTLKEDMKPKNEKENKEAVESKHPFTQDYEEKKQKEKTKEENARIEQLENCMKDKDKRISELESFANRFKCIRSIFYYIFCSTIIIGSYLLWLEAWVFIASNGKWNIIDFLVDLLSESNSIPYTLEPMASFILGLVMSILFGALTLGWFCIFKEDE